MFDHDDVFSQQGVTGPIIPAAIPYRRNPSLGSNSKSSRATSVVSTGSGRSSSGSGFRFPKPNLSFKPLYSHGNDSKNHQPSHGSHPHQHRSTPDLYANSPFPPVLLTIRLPQSLLNKYVIDQESFRHGKGIWGIGKYSWTVTVLSRSTGKKYVIKRVSKSLLPPSAYYHYPTTAHQLCTCPACRSSRDQLLLTGQLNPSDMDNIQEVLIIQNKGRRKELPQLPSPQPSQSHQRPLSASSVNTPTSATPKDKRRSFNMYSCNNASQPNPGRFLGFSPISSPQETPTNSRPTTPSPSPLRQQTTIPFPAPLSPSDPLSSLQTKTHRSPGQQPHPSSPSQFTPTSQSPLLPSATPPSWPQSDQNINQSLTGASFVPPSSGLVSQQDKTASSELSLDRVWTSPWTDISSGRRTRPNSPKPPSSSPIQFHEAGRGGEGVFVPMIPSRSASGSKKRPTLQRHKSTPNLSRPVTGLDSLEEDPMRLDQIRNLSKLNLNDRLNNDDNLVSKDTHLVDSPLSTTFTLPILARNNTKGGLGVKADTHLRKNGSDESHRWSREVAEVVERRVDPLDTQGGEFKRIEPEGPRSKPVEIEYTPPPHALPMELVLLQTFNDSDHLPEHHEWTQDKDYWYYVTKAHGVKRRKLKKVSSWWLDMSSLGGALLSGSSPSSEPIATGPIYNMGRSSPLPSSPLSSEVTLSRHMPKDSISSLTSQDSSVGSMTPTMAHAPVSASKKPSSPRNSHLGKYYYVDWEEYTSL
ncbi:hypothetical protein BG005_009788 [Podila minutissima]|nr:hypothetical protein BG005_009788 [Podila minutissima]